ncbi:hypothetical protein ADUPG1_010260 [Aduncisulcus paluster]|uniref:Peptidase A2 domain-containing protein n=1 Tax=Aduncisulcus paluster TaxID=2918883 RepID=A0ABQ5JTQ1_9EUKA|nr:hypothetical protein ADUPG1_010260 [Aduncisulcus paluster]
MRTPITQKKLRSLCGSIPKRFKWGENTFGKDKKSITDYFMTGLPSCLKRDIQAVLDHKSLQEHPELSEFSEDFAYFSDLIDQSKSKAKEKESREDDEICSSDDSEMRTPITQKKLRSLCGSIPKRFKWGENTFGKDKKSITDYFMTGLPSCLKRDIQAVLDHKSLQEHPELSEFSEDFAYFSDLIDQSKSKAKEKESREDDEICSSDDSEVRALEDLDKKLRVLERRRNIQTPKGEPDGKLIQETALTEEGKELEEELFLEVSPGLKVLLSHVEAGREVLAELPEVEMKHRQYGRRDQSFNKDKTGRIKCEFYSPEFRKKKIRINGVECSALLDTGAGKNYINQVIFEKLKAQGFKLKESSVKTLKLEINYHVLPTLPDVVIGNESIDALDLQRLEELKSTEEDPEETVEQPLDTELESIIRKHQAVFCEINEKPSLMEPMKIIMKSKYQGKSKVRRMSKEKEDYLRKFIKQLEDKKVVEEIQFKENASPVFVVPK